MCDFRKNERDLLVEFHGADFYEKICRHEAGHVLIAYLFENNVEYAKILLDEKKVGVTHIPGGLSCGDAHVAIAGYISDYLILKGKATLVDVLSELNTYIKSKDPDYLEFKASCERNGFCENDVIEQVFEIMCDYVCQLMQIKNIMEKNGLINKDEIIKVFNENKNNDVV